MSLFGTEFTLNVHLDPIDGFHMEDYDFECEFFVFAGKGVVVKKDKMIKMDEDNFTCILQKDDVLKIGRGQIKAMVTAYIPDTNFDNGVRIEKQMFVCKNAITN